MDHKTFRLSTADGCNTRVELVFAILLLILSGYYEVIGSGILCCHRARKDLTTRLKEMRFKGKIYSFESRSLSRDMNAKLIENVFRSRKTLPTENVIFSKRISRNHFGLFEQKIWISSRERPLNDVIQINI